MNWLLNRRTAIVLLLIAAFIFSNRRYQVNEVFRDSSSKVTMLDQENLSVDNNFKELDVPTYSMAGFPFRFWEKSEFDGKGFSHIYGGSLALNLLVWTLALGAFLGYEIYMARSLAKRLDANPQESKKRRMGLSDLMVLTGLIAVVIGYWRWSIYAASAEATLAATIRDTKGNVMQSLLLPEIVSARLPETWHADLKRLSEVGLINPSPELIDKAVKLPYLNHLTIDGGTGDLTALAQLKSRPLFVSLRIAARKMTEQDIDTIASLTQLQSLAICRSTFTDQWLSKLANMSRLQLLSVEDTAVTLKNISSLPCAKTLRMLNVPRPEAGLGDELVISNWPELKRLSCNSLHRKPNSEPVILTVTDMPKLQYLTLDNLQLYELTLDNLPEFLRIEGRKNYWQSRLANGAATSEDPLVSRLKVGELPKFESLMLHATALRELEFSAPLNCNCVLTTSIVRGGGGYTEYNRTPVARSRVQRWLDAFATGNGPKRLEFRHLDLRRTDFASLSKNPWIDRLRFPACEVDAAQIGALRGMQNLEVLDIGQIALTGEQIQAVIASMPKLIQFECDPNQVNRLKLENLPNIRSLFAVRTAPTQPLEALHLVHMTNLMEKIDLPPNLFYLHIDYAPSLTQLTTSGPWPAKAVLKGVRDLKVFSASGANLKDELIDELIKCEKLEHLTLTDHEISPTALARLGALTRLQSLTLSRTKLDDTAMEALAGLTQLIKLSVDETAITERSLATISKLTAIGQLSIAGTSIAPESLSQLSSMVRLSDLNCAGMKLTAEATRSLASIKTLAVLDLSNTELNAATLAPLGQLTGLQRLRLVESTIDGRALLSVADQAGSAQFDLTNSSIDRETFDLLRRSQRIWMPEPEDSRRMIFSN